MTVVSQVTEPEHALARRKRAGDAESIHLTRWIMAWTLKQRGYGFVALDDTARETD